MPIMIPSADNAVRIFRVRMPTVAVRAAQYLWVGDMATSNSRRT